MIVMIGIITMSIFHVAFFPSRVYSASVRTARFAGLTKQPASSLFFSWSTCSCSEAIPSFVVTEETLAFLFDAVLMRRGVNDIVYGDAKCVLDPWKMCCMSKEAETAVHRAICPVL